MTHIERMEKELKDLSEKINAGGAFLSKELEEARFTDERQRVMLGVQLDIMRMYRKMLKTRIDYDSRKK